jgi:hypothetical protein
LLPWWCGVLLIVTFPLGHFANALFSSAENLLLALLWGLDRDRTLGTPSGGRQAPPDAVRRDRLTLEG